MVQDNKVPTDDYERRQGTADKADNAFTLASVTAAQLDAHAREDQRQFVAIASTLSDMTKDIKGISKWIWIATGVMLALNKSLDFLAQHVGTK